MDEANENHNSINKLIKLSFLILLIFSILAVAKYIGVNSFINKIAKAIVPVIIAICVSFIVEPIIRFLERKNIKRRYAVLIAYFFFIMLIALIIYITLPQFIKQLKIFINNIPYLIETVESFLNKIGINTGGQDTSNTINNLIINISNAVLKKVSSSVSVIFDILLGLSGSIFLSFDFLKFKDETKKRIPKRIKEPTIYYFKNLLPFIHKYIFGMLIDSILIFIISIIGFSIIGIEYTLVIALFIAITNLIPIIGPYIGGIPAAIIGFSVSSTLGISAVVVVVIVQIIESNFMQPLILKNVIKLHPLEGILGISLFGALFGVVGMIFSPILVVAIKLLFLPYDENIEKEVNLT